MTPPLSPLLTAVLDQEDSDVAFLLAGAINLYHEAIHRRANRQRLNGPDVEAILTIVRLLLAGGDMEQEFAKLRGKP
jgi:hypothetical protein